MPNWKHTIKIKDIFMNFEGDPTSQQTFDMAQAVVKVLKNLQNNCSQDLSYDLESVIEEFLIIETSDEADDAQNQFNFALDELYDLGNDNHQIWVG